MSFSLFPNGAMNVLLIQLDDVGGEQFPDFGYGGQPPGVASASMPAFSSLYNGTVSHPSVRFHRFYCQDLCSPTRAATQTARYGCLTGIGTLIREDGGFPGQIIGLMRNELALAGLIKRLGLGHKCAFVGKWHLSESRQGGPRGPLEFGYDHYVGLKRNIQAPESYRNYPLSIEGIEHNERWFSTLELGNHAISWIRRQRSNPWFLNLAFFAAHTPNTGEDNTPPPDTYNTGAWGVPPITNLVNSFKAHQECADFAVAAVLKEINLDDTLVLYTSDNGSGGTNLAAEYMLVNGVPTQWDGAKGKDTVFEGGIRTILVAQGAGVTGASRNNSEVTNAVDIGPTIVEALGGSMPDDRVISGVSLFPILQNQPLVPHPVGVYSEGWDANQRNLPNKGTTPGARALIGQRYKIVRQSGDAFDPTKVEFYDLKPNGVDYDPIHGEQVNKTPGGSLTGLSAPERSAFNALNALQDEILAGVVEIGV